MTEQRPVAAVLGTELELRLFNYRDTTPLRAGQVDDEPYGGGAGMVLRVDVVAAALDAAYDVAPQHRVIALTPQGRLLTQKVVEELAVEPVLTVLSSRFEGFDDRIVTHLASDAISIGPYVLSGGELPAMVLLDAIARRLPGALAEGSGSHESFSDELAGGLEYPHYTRPAAFRGWTVPEVLLSGDHGRVEAGRGRQSPAPRAQGDGPGWHEPGARGERLQRSRDAGGPRRRRRGRDRLGPDLEIHRLRGRHRRVGHRLRHGLRRRPGVRRPALGRPAGDRNRQRPPRDPDRQVSRLRLCRAGGGGGLRHADRVALRRDAEAVPGESRRRLRALRHPLDGPCGRLGLVRAAAGTAGAGGGAACGAGARAGRAPGGLPRADRHADRAAAPVAEPGRPLHAGSSARLAGHDRLDRDDRGGDRDRARDQSVGRQPLSDPVLVDGAHAALRAAGERLRSALLRPRAREPVHLPLPRPEAWRGGRLPNATGRAAALRCRRHLREAADRPAGRPDRAAEHPGLELRLRQRPSARRAVHPAEQAGHARPGNVQRAAGAVLHDG